LAKSRILKVCGKINPQSVSNLVTVKENQPDGMQINHANEFQAQQGVHQARQEKIPIAVVEEEWAARAERAMTPVIAITVGVDVTAMTATTAQRRGVG